MSPTRTDRILFPTLLAWEPRTQRFGQLGPKGVGLALGLCVRDPRGFGLGKGPPLGELPIPCYLGLGCSVNLGGEPTHVTLQPGLRHFMLQPRLLLLWATSAAFFLRPRSSSLSAFLRSSLSRPGLYPNGARLVLANKPFKLVAVALANEMAHRLGYHGERDKRQPWFWVPP
jgi:hypothetical protein